MKSFNKTKIIVFLLVSSTLITGYFTTSYLGNHLDNLLFSKENISFGVDKNTTERHKEVINDYKNFAQNKVNKYFSDIRKASKACASTEKPDLCLYWLSFFTGAKSAPNNDLAKNKCRKISREQMGGCFDGFGNGLAQYYKNSSRAAEVCQKVDSRYRKSCWDGLSGGFGGIFFNNVTRAIIACNNLKESVKHRCYDGLGHGLAANFYNNPEKMFKSCMKVPKKYRRWCFKGLGFNMGLRYRNKADHSRKNCRKFENYSNYCLLGLGDSIGEFTTYANLNEAKEKCSFFASERMKRNCIEEIGFALGRNYIKNIDKGVEMCKKLGEKHTTYCLQGFKKTILRRYGHGNDFQEACQKLSEVNKNISC